MPTGERARSTMMSPREWNFVRTGAIISVIALVIVLGVLPFVRHWQARETQLNAERQRLAHLKSLVANRLAIDSASTSRESALSEMSRRVVRARSRALAAAALQSLLQEMAQTSNVTVTRLDVATAVASSDANAIVDGATSTNGDAAPDGEQLPVTMSAVGDIFGLTALLNQVRTGSRVIIVERLSVQVNSALRGAPDVLQMTLSMRAPAIVE